MGKDKQMNKELEYYNCREYFRYKTVIRIDKNILEEGREKQREEAVRLTKIWYQKAVELGDTELEKYFYQKFVGNSSSACQGKIQKYGKLKRDYFSVLGNQIQKKQIQKIYFLDNLPENIDARNVDVSTEQNGSVRLWLKKNGKGYDLNIGANGGVVAPEDCSELFSGFDHVDQIVFRKNFKTENVKNMSGMFAGCYRLEKVDTDNLAAENVEDISGMFFECENLKRLDLRNFDAGNIKSISNMLGCCRQLESVQGIKILRKLADAGDEEAMYFLGTCCEKGDETEESILQAMEWYKKSAEAGCAKAFRHIGDCYFEGKGTYRSRKNALEWWERAAEMGDGEASLKMAKELLEHSLYSIQELGKVQEFAGKAYQKGYLEAGLILAQVKKRLGDNEIMEKEKREQYYREADQLYDEAEKRNQRYAEAERAYFYLTKKYQPEKRKGIRLLEDYAAKKDALAQYYLGICYMTGNGVKKDKRYGKSLIQMAAEQGIQQAEKALEKWQIWLM